jgi:hypothetical protein
VFIDSFVAFTSLPCRLFSSVGQDESICLSYAFVPIKNIKSSPSHPSNSPRTSLTRPLVLGGVSKTFSISSVHDAEFGCVCLFSSVYAASSSVMLLLEPSVHPEICCICIRAYHPLADSNRINIASVRTTIALI